MEVSTVGYPVEVPVVLSQPPGNLLFLYIETIIQNPDYIALVTVEPEQIELLPKMLKTQFYITINSATLPPSVSLKFSLRSFYPIRHIIIPSEKILSFQLDQDAITDPPAFKIFIGDEENPKNEEQVGLPVLNINSVKEQDYLDKAS